jgi:hypothetical protein
MTKLNTGRVLLGGAVAALIIDMIEGVVNGVVLKADWAATMQALNRPTEVTGGAIAIYNIGGLLEGIVGVWLAAALISRYGTSSITAAKAGLVVWAMVSGLPNLMMLPSGIIPGQLMATVVLTDFLSLMLGIMMGARLYREEPAPMGAAAHA